MPFLTEPEPERGAVLPVMPGITRIVAANPGPMTYYGTNTYLIDTPDGVVVLDPGPEDHPEHVEAILRATGGNVALILVSHTHHDHVGAVAGIAGRRPARQRWGSVSAASTPSMPTSSWRDGERSPAWRRCTRRAMRWIICASRCRRRTAKVLFSADHVMSWSTSVVSPPGGNMTDYFNSLEVLLQRDDDVYPARSWSGVA